MDTNKIIKNILNELDRAEKKHPHWPTDQIHAAAIVAEEAGEFIRAVNQEKWDRRNPKASNIEAIQTAAMCVRFLKNR